MIKFSRKTKDFRSHPSMRTVAVAATAVILGLATVGPVRAATPPAATGGMSGGIAQSPQRARFEQARMEWRRAEQQLAQIQSKTLRDHPDLQKKRTQLVALMTDAMKRHGQDPEKDMAELRGLEAKLRGASISRADREKLTAQFERKLSAFQKARTEAMNSPRLQKARAKFSRALLTAMKKEDPQTGRLLREVKEKRQELMQMHRAILGGGRMGSGKSGK